jgi:hypothetical protein
VAKDKFVPYDNQKHGKYIVELRRGFSIFKQITAPQVAAIGDKDLGGAKFCIGCSYIDVPLKFFEAHTDDFDQYYFFLGGDASKVDEFDAEIEFSLDIKRNIFNYPACVHVPAGTMLGPLDAVKVNKPFMFIHIMLVSASPFRKTGD